MFTVYTREGCPYCRNALAFLGTLPHTVVRHRWEDTTLTKQQLFNQLHIPSHHVTFPLIFWNGSFVGGCREVYSHFSTRMV